MKKLFVLFKQSQQSLRAVFGNKVRSMLTLLGIVIGISSVISMISLGEGVNQAISGEINKLGARNLTILPGSNFGPGGNPNGDSENDSASQFGPPGVSSLTMEDLERLRDQSTLPYYEELSGLVSNPAVIKVNDKEVRLTVQAVSAEHFSILNLKANLGRIFSNREVANKDRFIILGSEVVAKIFGDEKEVIGKKLVIGQIEFEVISVLETQEKSVFENPNLFVFVPLTLAEDLFDSRNLTLIIGKVKSEDMIDKAKIETEKVLLTSHGIIDPKLADFGVFSSEDLLQTVNEITAVMTGLLAGIAGISLVVGGIGIMNIMLVAVIERTREIGLRKAVGARTQDILIQFLMEALLLTLFGGLIGIAIGFLFGKIVSNFIDFEPVVTLGAVFLAVGVSSFVGLVFGLYPAVKAARLNPIDALRYE